MNLENTAMIMVDIQEKLLPAMNQKEEVLDRCVRLLKGVMTLQIPTLVSEQYPRGLGETVGELKKEFRGNVPTISKTSFSCLGQQDMEDWVRGLNREYVLVCGIEAHICVMQTVLDLQRAGYKPVVISDCVTSRSIRDYTAAIERMRKEGVIVTTYEAVLFELLKDLKHPKFKEILAIIK